MSTQEISTTLLAIKEMNVADLMKVLKTVTAELEKKTKPVKAPKAVKGAKAPKEEKVKGETPTHLKKNNAWVAYVKEFTRKNGWEAFTIQQKTGELEIAASEFRDGVHVHGATGKGMIQKEAMSYAKSLWSAKTRTGSHKEIYEAFEAQYESGSDTEEPNVAATAAAAWVPPAEGTVKPWNYQGHVYLRDRDNHVWDMTKEGEMGTWKGLYLPMEDRMDTTVNEPVYE